MQEITTSAELRAAGKDDPLLVHLLPHLTPGRPAYAMDGAVLLAYDYWDDLGWLVIGPASAGARLVGEAAGLLNDGKHLSVPEESVDQLPAGWWQPHTPWRFRWSDRRPPAPTVDAHWLAESEWPDVDELLDDSFAEASVRPGNRHARRWAGIRGADGRLVACAADCTESEIGFMASIGSRLTARRTGVGLAITTWLTHRLLDDYGVAALWQYSSNTVATALYDRLGFTDDHRYVDGTFRA